MTIPIWLSILAFVFGSLGALGGAVAILRSRYREQTDTEREKYITALEERSRFLDEAHAQATTELEKTKRQLHNLEGKVCFLTELILKQCRRAEIDPSTGGCRFCAKGMAYGQGGAL